jgi:hypothetical protein
MGGVDAGELRGELVFRMRFWVGGEGVGRVRLSRRALLDSFKIGGPPLRILKTGASAAPIFSRAGVTALCGFESLDMHGFLSGCSHENRVELARFGCPEIL